jgi:hypothetical protein
LPHPSDCKIVWWFQNYYGFTAKKLLNWCCEYISTHVLMSICQQVLLSPAVVVYSPRVLPVYVYDAHADSAKNVRQVCGLLSNNTAGLQNFLMMAHSCKGCTACINYWTKSCIAIRSIHFVLFVYESHHTVVFVLDQSLHLVICWHFVLVYMSSGSFLVLYGIALATAGWGVVASLEIYPPFAGAAVSAITLVVAYGFAISRPQLTLKVWVEVAWLELGLLHNLSSR